MKLLPLLCYGRFVIEMLVSEVQSCSTPCWFQNFEQVTIERLDIAQEVFLRCI